jgi:hypothetical protein
MRTADDLLARYARTRDARDQTRDARNGCQCERCEGINPETLEMRSGEPCWKAARKWDNDNTPDEEPKGFHFDPMPDAWCPTCRQRQAFTEQLRAYVKAHAAAKRALLQRGRALVRRAEGSTQ